MEVKDALALMISFGALHIALIGLIVTVMALNQSKKK
ncbi:putative holin-like toxin [Paenibacillus sp. FSL R7-0216]